VATAAGTAVLLYLVLSGRLCGDAAAGADGGREDELVSSAVAESAVARSRRKEEARARREQRRARKRRWPERAPTGWGEAAAVAARTVRFTWAETLGKWPLGELAFGIKYYMRQQVGAPPAPITSFLTRSPSPPIALFLREIFQPLCTFVSSCGIWLPRGLEVIGLLPRDFPRSSEIIAFPFFLYSDIEKYGTFLGEEKHLLGLGPPSPPVSPFLDWLALAVPVSFLEKRIAGD
jgi:hypothetical protein